MTPELIMHSIKQNPKVFLETLHKFESFNLVSASMTKDQQLLVSKHMYLLNDFLRSDNGRSSVNLFAEEFIDYINKKVLVTDPLRTEFELRYRAELEDKIRAEFALKAIAA